MKIHHQQEINKSYHHYSEKHKNFLKEKKCIKVINYSFKI